MFTKQKALHLILALLKNGDIELLKSDTILDDAGCDDLDKERIRNIGFLVYDLYLSYDYLLSSGFLRLVDGKSEQYKQMKIKMESSPTKKRKHKEDLMSAVRELQSSKRLYDLAANSDQGKVDQLLDLLADLNIPPC